MNCSVVMCERYAFCKGFCKMHYLRQWKTGDVGHPLPMRSHEKPGYNAVHKRLMAQRGPASNYECSSWECHNRANDWSYDHHDQFELIGESSRGKTAPYSLDLNHYQPLCRSCHTKLDRLQETAA